MSFELKLSCLSSEQFEFIEKTCIFKKETGRYGEVKKIPLFRIEGDSIILPIGLQSKFIDKLPIKKWCSVSFNYDKRPYTSRTDPKRGNIEFASDKCNYNYRDQKSIVEEGLEMLKKRNTLFLSLPCGFGKTTIACCISQKLCLKTLILCHLSTVTEQWESELREFSSATVQRVKGERLNTDADIYLMGIIKASKMEKRELSDIGLVIIDEVHICSITAFHNTLLKLRPKYLIALSATPERPDGLHKNFKTYFDRSIIKRLEKREFTVYKFCTGIKPTVKYVVYKGRQVPHWITVKNSLAYNKERQRLIIDLLCEQREKTMVLSDRVEECKNIFKELYERFCNDEIALRPYLFTQNSDLPPKDIGVIVGSMKKGGVGFDDIEIKILVIVTDTKDIRQFEGRLRSLNSTVYDFVDNFSTLENHWKLRRKWYKNKGATIKELNTEIHTCVQNMKEGIVHETNFLKRR